jgi:amino acid transporter
MHGIFESMGQVAPAADVAILMVGTFEFSGVASTFSVILAWLIYALWMVTPYQFSKLKANAGSYYSYAASSTRRGLLGPPTILSFMYYDITGAAFGILGISSFLFLISPEISGFQYLWIVFAAAFTAYITIITYIGVKPSMKYLAWTGMAEIAFLFIAAVIIIVKVGPHNSVVPFTIPHNVGISAVLFGSIFSILDFTGSGVVTTVSEEMKEPRKNIGKSILFAMLLTAVALIPTTYALTVGWGVNHISGFAAVNDGGIIVFQKYLGIVGAVLLIVFTVNSYLTNGVAKATAVSRLWYSAARDGVALPKKFGVVHSKYKTPHMTLLLWSIGSFILDLIMGLIYGPKAAALILTEGSGLAIITVHIMANSGLTMYSIRNRKGKPWTQILAPTASSVIGVVVIVISIYFTISSYLTSPSASNLAYLISTAVTIAWILGAGFLVTIFYARKRPDTLVKAGEYDASAQ